MSVQQDADGQRSVQAEVEVARTPEQVWQAIATGPGISSWFVPSEVEERVGGKAVSNFGPGMESVGTITAWEPPRRFIVGTPAYGEEEPATATEWTVEAREGAGASYALSTAGSQTSDTWDDQFVGHTYGWQAFFRVLSLYLSHLDGRPLMPVQAVGFAPEPKELAWATVTSALGIENATVGDRVHSRASAPRLAGTVEWAGQPEAPEELLIRLDEPTYGIAHLVAHSMGRQVLLTVRLYLLGDAAGEASGWQEWLDQRAEQPDPVR
jgi:uncharacterized protein YndB with AHSA1/START domain